MGRIRLRQGAPVGAQEEIQEDIRETNRKRERKGIYLTCSEFFRKSKGVPRKKAESLALVFFVCGDQATNTVVQSLYDLRCFVGLTWESNFHHLNFFLLSTTNIHINF